MNVCVLVVKSEAVHGPAVGCIVWLDLFRLVLWNIKITSASQVQILRCLRVGRNLKRLLLDCALPVPGQQAAFMLDLSSSPLQQFCESNDSTEVRLVQCPNRLVQIIG